MCTPSGMWWWKWIGPGWKRSRSSVSVATMPGDGWAPVQTANMAMASPISASSGTRQTAERSVIGSWRTENALRLRTRTSAAAHVRIVSSKSRPLSRSNSPSAIISATAVCSARRRRLARYGATSSSAAPAGSDSAWNSRIASTGSNSSSRWPRQRMFGVSVEAMLTSPTSAAPTAANAGTRFLRACIERLME